MKLLFIFIMGKAFCKNECDDKLAPLSILSDVRQAASAFHDSLTKISEKALSSEGTAHSLGKPKFTEILCLQFITRKRFVLLTLSLLQSYVICLFMYSRSIDQGVCTENLRNLQNIAEVLLRFIAWPVVRRPGSSAYILNQIAEPNIRKLFLLTMFIIIL